MKKLILTFFLVCLTANTIQAFNINNCTKSMQLTDLNSKNLLNYIIENQLTDKIMEVCSDNLCSNINVSHLEQDIKSFIQKNIKYLKSKDEESSIEAELKGFRINKLIINDCD